MAIQKTILCSSGITVEQAYIKISKLTYDNIEKKTYLTIHAYKDRNYSDLNSPFVDIDYQEFNGCMSVADAYITVKTIEKYSNSVDI